MSPARTIESRLEETESRAAIADLMHAYARVIRQDRPQDAPALFLRDAVFEIRDGHPSLPDHTIRARLEGREHIATYLGRGGGGRPHPVPLIHNLMIELDGDMARANCVMEAQVLGTDRKVFGDYADTFRRVEGRWQFASRTYTIYTAGSSV